LAAESKMKQQEKKEKEKIKKEEEKKRKAEEQEIQKREQQRVDAKKKAEEQAEKDRATSVAMQEQRALDRITSVFDEDRCERLDALDLLSNEDLMNNLEQALEADASLRGALHILRKSANDEEFRIDCLVALVHDITPVWPLSLCLPADAKPSASVRNRSKKARTRLRDVATKFLLSLKPGSGADGVAEVTKHQHGFIKGLYEWPFWTLEGREEELRLREEAKAAALAAAPAPSEESKEAKISNKTKKAKEKVQEKEKGDEDIDALLNEFGVTVTEKKKKKSKK